MPARARRQSLPWFLACCALWLGACGFHLRGSLGVAFPEALSRLRVEAPDSKLANDPLLVLAKNRLQADAQVVVTDEPDTPTLALFDEHTDTQVLSVSTGGRASGYTLKYQVSFRLLDAGGKVVLGPQTVTLLRDYTFDPTSVLAKEHEEAELKRTLQRDAVQQILRRLSRYVPKSG